MSYMESYMEFGRTLVKSLHFVGFQWILALACWDLEIIRSDDEFSTAWRCKGCKIYVVLVSPGGVILITLLRIFPESGNLTKWKESSPCRAFFFYIKFWLISSFVILMIRVLSTFYPSVLIM